MYGHAIFLWFQASTNTNLILVAGPNSLPKAYPRFAYRKWMIIVCSAAHANESTPMNPAVAVTRARAEGAVSYDLVHSPRVCSSLTCFGRHYRRGRLVLQHCYMFLSDRLRSAACTVSLFWFVVTAIAATAAQSETQVPWKHTLQGHDRGLTAEAAECYTAETAAASVNTTLQLQLEQQLTGQEVQQNLISALSQYLRVSDCNVNSTFSSSTVCPATSTTNSNHTCSDGQYICRGVVQVSQDLYTAVQDNQCTPDASGSTATCQGTEMDLTTYLSIQQGQCCLQCPGQQDCTADASDASQNSSQTAAEAYNCGTFTASIAVGSSLEGSSLEDLLDTAVGGGLLDLYLQTSGLSEASVLSVGPTGSCLACPVLSMVSVLSSFFMPYETSRMNVLPKVQSKELGSSLSAHSCHFTASHISAAAWQAYPGMSHHA